MCDWFCVSEKRCMVAEYRKIVIQPQIDLNRQCTIAAKMIKNNKTKSVKNKLPVH